MRRLALVVVLAACSDVDPRWQLDHDRIIAVRATPPHLPAGATSTIDGFLAHSDGAPTDVEAPLGVIIAFPFPGVADPVYSAGAWTITAPSQDVIDAARAQLMLPAGSPVPLTLGVEFAPSNGITLNAIKTIYLGDAADNPELGPITIAGSAVGPATDSLTVPPDTDEALEIFADQADQVYWLTSCGTMHDDDEHDAFLHVLPTDPQDGQLAIVLRDAQGGVVWRVWQIAAM